MSDSTQGPGWWQASDGKWYPPEQHPDAGAPTEAVEATPPTAAMPPVAAPAGGPPVVPAGPPPGPIGGPPVASSNARWIVLGVVAAVVIAIVAFLLLRGDDKKQGVAANSSSGVSSSSSSSSKSSSSPSSSSSSSAAIGELSKGQLQQRLLNASDVSSDFSDNSFSQDTTTPQPCGQPNLNSQLPPKIDVGSEASSSDAFVEEEVSVYNSESDAHQVVTLFEEAVGCSSPTVDSSGGSLQVNGPNDVSSDLAISVDEALEYDVLTDEAQGKVFIIRTGNALIEFTLLARTGTEVSQLPSEIDVVNAGLVKLSA